jgi:hypothetical protein
MAQVVEHLLCKCEALSSNPTPANIEKQRHEKKKKGLGAWFKWYSACLVSTRP